MTREEVLHAMEEVASLPRGTLQGNELLASVEGWDSLSGVAFRVAIQKRWNRSLAGTALSRCETVPDVLRLLGLK